MSDALLRLLQLTDPTLPIGGFSHSAGLETYVQQGSVYNVATTLQFVTAMLSRNLRYTDAAFVALAYRAAQAKDEATIRQLDIECNAVKIPAEMRMASQKLGLRLLKIMTPLYQFAMLQQYLQQIQSGQLNGHYCIAFGLSAALMEVDLLSALQGFYYNAAVGMVTNAVKLVPLGQQDGQLILHQLHPLIRQLAADSQQPNEALIGICCTGFDIRSMQHEQLYSRLYMS